MKITRLRDLKPGQPIWVQYENPEPIFSKEELQKEDPEPDFEILKALLIVEKVWQATTLWEGGTLLPGEWRAELRPAVKTDIEDHLKEGETLGGLPTKVLPMTAFEEMFGMDVEEEFDDGTEAYKRELGNEAHTLKYDGKEEEAKLLEEALIKIADSFKDAPVTLWFSWGPGVETEVEIETFEE